MGFHAFKMADKIARKEGHRQVFVEYVNEIAYNSRTASFRFYEDFTEIGHKQSPEILKKFLLTNWPPIIALGLSFTRMTPSGSRDISNRNTGFEQLSTIPLFSLLNE